MFECDVIDRMCDWYLTLKKSEGEYPLKIKSLGGMLPVLAIYTVSGKIE